MSYLETVQCLGKDENHDIICRFSIAYNFVR